MSLVYHGSILLYSALARENELAARFFIGQLVGSETIVTFAPQGV